MHNALVTCSSKYIYVPLTLSKFLYLFMCVHKELTTDDRRKGQTIHIYMDIDMAMAMVTVYSGSSGNMEYETESELSLLF